MHFVADSFSSGSTELVDQSRITTLPVEIQAVIRAWMRFSELAAEAERQTQLLRIEERVARGLGAEHRNAGILNDGTTNFDAILNEVTQNARTALISYIRKIFVPCGAPLVLDESAEYAAYQATRSLGFCPTSYWTFLFSRYGGCGGTKKAYSDAAEELRGVLRMKADEPLKMVTGRIVIPITIYAEPYSRAALSNDSERKLIRVLDGIKAAASWAGVWSNELAAASEVILNVIRAASKWEAPRPDRQALTDIITIVPFTSRWEFRTLPSFAETIQLFLAEFPNTDRNH